MVGMELLHALRGLAAAKPVEDEPLEQDEANTENEHHTRERRKERLEVAKGIRTSEAVVAIVVKVKVVNLGRALRLVGIGRHGLTCDVFAGEDAL